MITVTLKSGAEREFPSFAESNELDDATIEYIWEYGVKQCINDATAPVVKAKHEPSKKNDFRTFDDEVNYRADVRIANLWSGNVPTRRARVSVTELKSRQVAKELSTKLGSLDEAMMKKIFVLADQLRAEKAAAE